MVVKMLSSCPMRIGTKCYRLEQERESVAGRALDLDSGDVASRASLATGSWV